MRKAILYLAFLSLFMSMKCEDDKVPEGKLVHVHGRIYDQWDGLAAVNQKLIVSEYNDNTSYGELPDSDYIGDVGTVYTDENGFYDLTFTTSGSGDTYYIYWVEENDYIWTYSNENRELDVNISNEVNFDFVHLFPSTLKITTAPDLNYLPISISHHFTSTVLDKLEEAGTENIRSIAIIKNSSVEVTFYRRLPDQTSQQAVFEFPTTNTTEPTEFEIHLTNDDFHE